MTQILTQIPTPTPSFLVFKTRSQKSLCAPYVIKKKCPVFSISGHVLKPEKLMHPLCAREKVVIISISGHVLKPENWKAYAPLMRKRKGGHYFHFQATCWIEKSLCAPYVIEKKWTVFSISGHVLKPEKLMWLRKGGIFSISGHGLKPEKLMHPLCDREKVVIISISGHVLKTEKLMHPLCDREKVVIISISGHVLKPEKLIRP